METALPGLYIHVQDASHSATRSQCSRTRLLGSERRVSSSSRNRSLGTEPFWQWQSEIRLHFAGSEAKMRVEDAQKYWQYGVRPYQMSATDRLDPIMQAVGEKRIR